MYKLNLTQTDARQSFTKTKDMSTIFSMEIEPLKSGNKNARKACDVPNQNMVVSSRAHTVKLRRIPGSNMNGSTSKPGTYQE